jgi:LysM repeat protein
MNEISITEGDTLYNLASTHGTTVQQLQEINNIENPDLIKVGDILKLPNSTVEPNDTPEPNNAAETNAVSGDMFSNPDMLKNMLNLLSSGMGNATNEDKIHALDELSDKSSESSYTASIDNLNDIANSIFVNNNGENICEILTKINENLSTLVKHKHE